MAGLKGAEWHPFFLGGIIVEFIVHVPFAKSVVITGEHSGLGPVQIPLTSERNGQWTSDIDLPAGMLRYQYEVDGTFRLGGCDPYGQWQEDQNGLIGTLQLPIRSRRLSPPPLLSMTFCKRIAINQQQDFVVVTATKAFSNADPYVGIHLAFAELTAPVAVVAFFYSEASQSLRIYREVLISASDKPLRTGCLGFQISPLIKPGRYRASLIANGQPLGSEETLIIKDYTAYAPPMR